ncbi:MAG: sodium:solute symporter [Rikenellaceae bacterium]
MQIFFDMTPISVALTLAAYLTVLLSLTWYTSRRAKNNDYFVAGRNVRWYIAAMAMISAAMSGITFVSVPGSVAADSFSYMQMVLGFTVGQMVIAFVLIPIFYRLQVRSLYEYLDERFGLASHRSGAWLFFISKLTISALRLFLMCTVMQMLLFDHYGIPFWVNIIFTMAVVFTATRRGGVKSLVWTDILKSVSLISALVLCIYYIATSFGWGMGEMIREIHACEYSQIFFFDDPSSPRYFWKMFFAGMFTLVAMTGLDQDMMQCNLSCVDYKNAQINIVLTAICQIFVILLFLLLGALLYIYAAAHAIELPSSGDQLFSLIAVESGLPAIVGVMFIIGLCSSSYSSAASSLTALTTSFTLDMLKGGDRDEASLTKLRRRVHLSIAAATAVVIFIVGLLSETSLINTLFKFVGYTYGPILGLFSFGILTKIRVKDRLVPALPSPRS